MAEKTRTEIIVIKETLPERLASNAITFAFFVAFIGVGWLAESAALQWVGAILGFITLYRRASNSIARLTIDEARAKLDELERA